MSYPENTPEFYEGTLMGTAMEKMMMAFDEELHADGTDAAYFTVEIKISTGDHTYSRTRRGLNTE
jgi:hypothetical protein